MQINFIKTGADLWKVQVHLVSHEINPLQVLSYFLLSVLFYAHKHNLTDLLTSVTKGRTQKLPQKIKIAETYRHDHSLESSWGALSDGTIRFLIQPS
jgi:hypothetical protein